MARFKCGDIIEDKSYIAYRYMMILSERDEGNTKGKFYKVFYFNLGYVGKRFYISFDCKNSKLISPSELWKD